MDHKFYIIVVLPLIVFNKIMQKSESKFICQVYLPAIHKTSQSLSLVQTEPAQTHRIADLGPRGLQNVTGSSVVA